VLVSEKPLESPAIAAVTVYVPALVLARKDTNALPGPSVTAVIVVVLLENVPLAIAGGFVKLGAVNVTVTPEEAVRRCCRP
jgi:hypothetical protein